MALKKCRECGREISTEAESCPGCGAKQPKRTSLLTWLIALVLGFGLIAAFCSGSDESSNASRQAARATAPPKDPGAQKRKAIGELQTIHKALGEMDVKSIQGTGWTGVLLVLQVFNKSSSVLRTLGKQTLDVDEVKSVDAFRTLLVKRQVEAFPVLRKLGAKEIDAKLWESDVDVEATGKGAGVITFVGGMFAANRNIAQAQEAFGPLMTRLRYSQSRYKWTASAQEWSVYDLNPLKDSDIAEVSEQGQIEKL